MELTKNKNNVLKRGRFIRIAERRVNKILDDIDSLGKCSNKRNYEYSEEDIRKIFKAVDERLRSVRVLFSSPENHKNYFSLK